MSFLRGAWLAICVLAFFQDLVGKEAYTQMIDRYWLNIPFWIWLLPIAVIVGSEERSRRKGRE